MQIKRDKLAHALQVFRRIDAGRRGRIGHMDGDRDSRATARATAPALRSIPAATLPAPGRLAGSVAVGVQADVAQRHVAGRQGSVSLDCAKASRCHGNGGAREIQGPPALSSTTLTTFGLKASAASCSGWAQVAIGTSAPMRAAQAGNSSGSISGSSPCRLTTTASAGSRARAPLRRCGRCRTDGRRGSCRLPRRARRRRRGCRHGRWRR
jgi:hypothetical protein